MSGGCSSRGHNPFPPGRLEGQSALTDAPHGNENCLARLPADDTDLDLVVAGESFFEGALYFSAGILWLLPYTRSHQFTPVANSSAAKVQPVDR